MSIQIPCPQCGKELRLPDRSLLGRKGKCPKCSHTFILTEPALAPVPAPAHPEPRPTGPLASSQPAEKEVLQQPAATGFPPNFPADFLTLDRTAESTGTAAKLKQRQRASARRRNIGIAVGGLCVLAVAAFVVFSPYLRSGGIPVESNVSGKIPPESNPVEGDHPGSNETTADSPSHGQPIDLQYIPFGTQVVLNLRPAELWEKGSLGEEIRACVPPLAQLVETTLQDLFHRKPEQVEELLICLLPGVRGEPPDVAAVVHMLEEQKRSELIDQFGQRIDTYEHPVYQSGQRAYLIIDQKTFAVCPINQAQEMVDAIKARHPAEQIDPLLPMTDRNHQLTVVFTPQTFMLNDMWFPANVRPFVQNSLDWLGDEIETVAWSFHLSDDEFFSEILLQGKQMVGRNAAQRLADDVTARLSRLAADLVPQFQMMNPSELGKRMVIGRVPAMVEVFGLATEVSTGPQYVLLTTHLPDRAGPNLALGTLLAWDESTRTDFTKAKPAETTATQIPDLVADRLNLKIDVDFRRTPLNEAFAYISAEIKTPIVIDGDALKLGAFTKNIPQIFKMDAASVRDVVLKIFEESKGIDPKPEKTLVVVIDEIKKSILITTLAAADEEGLKPHPLSK